MKKNHTSLIWKCMMPMLIFHYVRECLIVRWTIWTTQCSKLKGGGVILVSPVSIPSRISSTARHISSWGRGNPSAQTKTLCHILKKSWPSDWNSTWTNEVFRRLVLYDCNGESPLVVQLWSKICRDGKLCIRCSSLPLWQFIFCWLTYIFCLHLLRK